ncbi:MAG: glycoside hydrolase family 172 protein [bacterium]
MNGAPYGGLLASLTRVRDARSARSSSWDQSGRNRDAWIVMPGETAVLADLEGPGCITHIWMTQFCRRIVGPNWEVNDPDYYRKVLLRMYWDDQDHPSVLVPLGDFFCLGHSIAGNFASIPFTVSANDNQRNKFGGSAALNCYLQMPFNKRARVEIENQNDVPYGQYFYIDYELYREPLGDDIAYFHAQWRRENPCGGWDPEIQVNCPEADVSNLDGKGNYVILEAEGRGHYIGCNISVTNFQGTWWGEGDDMFFIDGEEWPPSLHGTGSEDYFNQAWGMQRNAYPMNGSALYEGDVPGYQVSYRFHLVDPVRFSKSIRVTIEHGHGNHSVNDWASTAYWYQTLPSKPFDILPVEKRLPIRHGDLGVIPIAPTEPIPRTRLNEEMRKSRAEWRRRGKEYRKERDGRARENAASSRRYSKANIQQARRIRRSFR